MQGKWIKIVAAAIAAPVVTISALHLVRAYEAGTTFQPFGSERDLQVNQVVFSGDEDTASQKDNTDQNGERESELWEKDKTAEDSLGPNLRNNANYLFQTGKANLPDGAENINLAGEEAGNNALLPEQDTTQNTDSNNNFIYDVVNAPDNADITIAGDGGQESGQTGTSGNGSQMNEQPTAAPGTPQPGNQVKPTPQPLPTTTPQPTARPSDAIKDPQPSKPTPDGRPGSIFIDREFAEEPGKYTDEDVLIVAALNMSENELYRGQKISAYDIFCVMDAGVTLRSATTPVRYLWGEEDLDRYIRIDGVSFDEGKTWIPANEFPVEIPMDARKLWVKASYRLTLDEEWKEYTANDIEYGVKTSKIYVLSRMLTEDDTEIPQDSILNNMYQLYPNVGDFVNLYQMQEKYINETQPYAPWSLSELFSGWTEDGEPVDWMYEVTPGRHILEPGNIYPLEDGYSVKLQDFVIDGDNCPLQTLYFWTDDMLTDGGMNVPEGVQAVEPDISYWYWDIPHVDSMTIPATMKTIDMSSLIVNHKFVVNEDNTEYASNEDGWILDKSETELLAVPYFTEEIELPPTIQKIDIPGFNSLTEIRLTAQNKEQIPEISTDGLEQCDIVVPDHLIPEFFEKNPIEYEEYKDISVVSDEGIVYSLENAKIVSENGELRKVQTNDSSSVFLSEDITSIHAGAFQRPEDGTKTAGMLVLSESGTNVKLEEGCFADSDIRTIQCYTGEQAANVMQQLKKQGIKDITVQTVGTSKEGFRYTVVEDENGKNTVLLKAPKELKIFDGTVTAADGSKVEITSIGDHAFSDCEALEWISLPESVNTIGYEAFCGCASLQGILINTTDTITIGNRSMEECPELRFVASNAMHAVRIADYDPEITDTGFAVTAKPHYFYVLFGAEGYGRNSVYFVNNEDEASNVSKYELVSLDKEGDCRVLYGANEIAGNWIAVRSGTRVPEKLVLPAGTVEIFEHALAGTESDSGSGWYTLNWSGLTKLQYIDAQAFENSKVSGDISFGKGLSYELGDQAFAGCDGITTVNLQGEAVKIGQAVFVNCSAMQKIIYGPMRQDCAIYSDNFDGCDQLTDIYFTDGNVSLAFTSYSAGWGYYFNMDNYDAKISLHAPADTVNDYIREWRYMIAGYVETPSQPAYLGMWQDIRFKNLNWDTFEFLSDEEVDAIAKETLLEGENHLRQMFGLEALSEPSDFYPYHVGDDGFITLVGAPSDATEISLDADTLELLEGWCLDYVGADAFRNSKKLKMVVFQDDFSGIYSNAFRGVASDSLTLVFEENTPPLLMTKNEEEQFSFGIEGSKITVIVPEGAEAAYYDAWKDYGVTIAGYSAPAAMSVSGGDVKVSVSDGDAKPQPKQDKADTNGTDDIALPNTADDIINADSTKEEDRSNTEEDASDTSTAQEETIQ